MTILYIASCTVIGGNIAKIGVFLHVAAYNSYMFSTCIAIHVLLPVLVYFLYCCVNKNKFSSLFYEVVGSIVNIVNFCLFALQ